MEFDLFHFGKVEQSTSTAKGILFRPFFSSVPSDQGRNRGGSIVTFANVGRDSIADNDERSRCNLGLFFQLATGKRCATTDSVEPENDRSRVTVRV